MMRFFRATIYVAASFGIYFLLRLSFPKYEEAMNIYFVLFLLDGYLWSSTRTALKRYTPLIRITAAILYWLPAIMILTGILYGWFVSFLEWNILFRTELLNLIQIGYIMKLVPVSLRIGLDLLKMFRYLIPGRKSAQIQSSQFPRLVMIVGWSLSLLAGIIFWSGHFFWQYRFRLGQANLVIKDLPKSFDKLRIIHISDLHLGNWTCPEKLENVIRRINQLKPDLVFVTGDMITYSSYDLLPFQDILSELKAREGIFVVYGNHDYGQYYKYKDHKEIIQHMDRCAQVYEEMGWVLLCNEQRTLKREEESIAILGTHNWGAEARFPKLADIIQAERGTEHIKTKLLLTHDPTFWEGFISKKQPDIDITFSGHTHGGQIGTENKFFSFSLVSLLHPFWAGLYENVPKQGEVQYLYVNRGLGTVGYFGRIGIPPEITLLILHPASD